MDGIDGVEIRCLLCGCAEVEAVLGYDRVGCCCGSIVEGKGIVGGITILEFAMEA
jgi:hypothetical protein